jgi:hypothetical protein
MLATPLPLGGGVVELEVVVLPVVVVLDVEVAEVGGVPPEE